ncbi:MAG TPA: cytochrome b N-terminal domain-containing protein [Tepidisphaeraceae bacterium]|nr:cytochrome b N-terminal domain-containing protein [Tepidisphaeraceae bacterium]
MNFIQRITASQPWKAIFRHPLPHDRRTRALAITSNLFLHLHPATLRRDSLRLSFTWCMGGLTFFLFLVEAFTGILLMFYYRPTVQHAYHDMVALRAQVPFGILRELHRWAAHAMVITVWLHMLRVFLTGSYKPPREFNWIVGVALLLLTMLLSFTGYLLPWDQLAIWAVTVGTNMANSAPFIGPNLRFFLLGDSSVGENALLRFYVLHCALLPLITTILCAVHFWRVRKDGGISSPL